MARRLVRYTIAVRGAAGEAILAEDAIVQVLDPGTSGVIPWYPTETGGVSSVAPIRSSNVGEVQVWIDESAPVLVDLSVSSDALTKRAGTGSPLTVPAFTEPIDLGGSAPIDGAVTTPSLRTIGTGPLQAASTVEIDQAIGDLPTLTDGTNTVVNTSVPGFISIDTVGVSTVDVQDFASSGTWTKPDGAKVVIVTLIGGGGGGGSGRRGAAGTLRLGGGGGGSGAAATYVVPADAFDTTEAITVGAGGSARVGVTADDTNGVTGGGGGASSIGGHLTAAGGAGGLGGNAASSRRTPAIASMFMSGYGGSSVLDGFAAERGGEGFIGGGGAGMFILADNTNPPLPAAGGSGSGGAGAGDLTFGTGGAGGGGGHTANGYNGSAGFAPGGGGGGGSASLNGTTSGASGGGGAGWVRVVTIS